MLLYAATIFVSAFLLFLVQPIIAKQILPWFGGSAGVWSTCLVFFQLWLLAGYTYADALSRCKLKTQAVVHTLLVLLALLTLPIIADPAWKPQGNEDPGWRILALLIATIGLPYFLVATTGPLVQSWFAKAFINDPRHVKVYRLFALSNLASLLALVAYPFAVEPVIELQTQSWAWSGGFVLFALLVIATAWRTQRNTVFDASLPLPQSNTDAIPPRWTDYVLWLLLAALLTPLMAWGLQADRGVLHFEKALPLYCIGLFVVCMFCHGELAAARPAPRYLTRFYLMISVGGALGGLFVGVVAPRIFSGYWETPATLVLVSILMILVILKSIPHWRGLTLVLTLLAGGISSYYGLKYVELMRDDALLMQRNFYGTIRVKEQGTDTGNPVRHLMHGVILHGEQYQTPALRLLATTYYGPESGAGLALSLTQGPGQRIGVVGLGVGTLASYAAADSKLFLYEINPQVVEAARQFFSYLSDTPAQSETILGDARLSLEREASRQFDVLVIDAFSSDAIPVHLLTREALDIYLRHMKPNGVMAFHVTNRYLNLAPVVKQLADQAGLHSVLVSDEPEEYWLSRTDYVLVARDPKLLQQPKIAARAHEITPIPGLKLWTDSYNNLFKVLK